MPTNVQPAIGMPSDLKTVHAVTLPIVWAAIARLAPNMVLHLILHRTSVVTHKASRRSVSPGVRLIMAPTVEFLQAYNSGHKLYSLRSSVSAASSMIYSKEQELERTEKRIVAAEAAVISDQATSEERVVLLDELKDLSERTGKLEAEIKQLIADRARIEQELQYYEQTVTAYRY